ncbi:MAG: hypothetical protein ACUVT9_05345 [Candidatus Bathycorpusculaceae bacterium]
MTLVLCFVIGSVNGYAIQTYIAPRSPSRTIAGANVFVTIQTDMGVYAIPIHNVITDIGEDYVRDCMQSGGTVTPIKYISIGNATASTTLTQLTTQYAREEGTISDDWDYNGDPAYNVTHKFTFTETVNLNAAGGHWGASGDNNMYSVANFDATTFQNNWNLTIIWVYVFDGN